MCEIYPEKVLALTGDQLKAFDYTLRLAINAGPVSACSALDAITELSENMYKSPKNPEKHLINNLPLHENPDIINFLENMIKPVFEASLLYSKNTQEMGGSCSRTYYNLFRSHNYISHKCIHHLKSLIETVEDVTYKNMVKTELEGLVKIMLECINMQEIVSRQNIRKIKEKFCTSFDATISKVAPIIVVK